MKSQVKVSFVHKSFTKNKILHKEQDLFETGFMTVVRDWGAEPPKYPTVKKCNLMQ